MPAKITITIRKFVYGLIYMINTIVNQKTNLVILCYHSISPNNWRFSISKQTFIKQMRYLIENNYTFVSISQVNSFIRNKKNLPEKSVLITFDDGYKNILDIAKFIKRYAIKPALFVIADSKKAKREELETNLSFLSDIQIKQLSKDGWTIGSHSMTHMNFFDINENRIIEEVQESRKELQKRLGISVSYFSYPKGSYSNKVKNITKKSHYKMALTMDDSVINSKTDLFAVPRVGIDQTHDFYEFKATISPLAIKLRSVIKNYIKTAI